MSKTPLGDRLQAAIEAHRSRGEKPTRIHMGPKEAGALAAEDDPLSIYRPDGTVEGYLGVPLLVIPGLTTVTVNAEVVGQRGRSSTTVKF